MSHSIWILIVCTGCICDSSAALHLADHVFNQGPDAGGICGWHLALPHPWLLQTDRFSGKSNSHHSDFQVNQVVRTLIFHPEVQISFVSTHKAQKSKHCTIFFTYLCWIWTLWTTNLWNNLRWHLPVLVWLLRLVGLLLKQSFDNDESHELLFCPGMAGGRDSGVLFAGPSMGWTDHYVQL